MDDWLVADWFAAVELEGLGKEGDEGYWLLAVIVESESLSVPLVVVDVEALVPGSQSWCTGLAECSLASPVDLLASLPAFGFLNELHGGSVLDAVADADGVYVEVERSAVDERPESLAKAGTARKAATAIALANWGRIMVPPCVWDVHV